MMEFNFSVTVLEVYAFDGKVKKEKWNENGIRLQGKIVSLM